MFQRVLWVSLTQALRSVFILVLPIAFISLFAWATAGSSNGNTADPMRATMWIWLAAHHIPFHLVLPPGGESGLLSYLPVGALIFPLLSIRNGFKRACDRIDSDQQTRQLARVLFALTYAGVSLSISWFSATAAITPNLYWTPAIAVALVWVATVSNKIKVNRAEISSRSMALSVIAILFGASSLVFGLGLFFHLKSVQNLTIVLQPGFVGGILLLLLNVLYLPNAVIATLSYLVGPGFAVGTNTLVSPLTHRLSEIPALPLLGGLPTGRHPLVLLSIMGVVALGAFIYNLTITQRSRVTVQSFLLTSLGITALAILGSGSLLTNALRSVGVSPWQLPLAIAMEIALGIFLAIIIPRISEFLPGRRSG